MADFIIEFVHWFANTLEDIIDRAWEAMRVAAAVVVFAVTLPVWLLPFLLWLFFVRGREGDSHADNHD